MFLSVLGIIIIVIGFVLARTDYYNDNSKDA